MILAALLTMSLGQCAPYTRTRTNDINPNAPCLFWRENSQIEWRINDQGNPENVGDVEFVAAEKALAVWQAALTGCGSLTLSVGPRTASRLATWDKNSSTNLNVVLWRFQRCSAVAPANDSCFNDGSCGNKYDCWQHSNLALAITTTSFEPSTGRIADADIELNTPSFLFTTVDSPPCVSPNFMLTCVATDIQNALTHEFGHSLGLAHNCQAGSVMSAMTVPGELSKRVLDNGSRLAMCELYPKGKVSLECGAGGGAGGGGSGVGGGTGGGSGGGVGGGVAGGVGGAGGAGGGGADGKRGCGCAGGTDGVLGIALLGLVALARRRSA